MEGYVGPAAARTPQSVKASEPIPLREYDLPYGTKAITDYLEITRTKCQTLITRDPRRAAAPALSTAGPLPASSLRHWELASRRSGKFVPTGRVPHPKCSRSEVLQAHGGCDQRDRSDHKDHHIDSEPTRDALRNHGRNPSQPALYDGLERYVVIWFTL